MRAGLYARVSTHDQQTLGLQTEAMAAYIKNRGWVATRRIEDVGSGSKERPAAAGVCLGLPLEFPLAALGFDAGGVAF